MEKMRLRIDENNHTKVSVKYIAEQMGVSPEHISAIKAGRKWWSFLSSLKKMADVLGCYPAELLPFEWQKPEGLPNLELLKESIRAAFIEDSEEYKKLTGKTPEIDVIAEMAYTRFLRKVEDKKHLN
jgi:DNA-binding Xre family transcriptional regulator